VGIAVVRGIEAGAAEQVVGAAAALQPVVAAEPVDQVVAIAAVDPIGVVGDAVLVGEKIVALAGANEGGHGCTSVSPRGLPHRAAGRSLAARRCPG
jgi:hypothetical protein